MVEEKYVKVEGEDRTTYVEVPKSDPIVTPNAVASFLVRPEIRNSDFQKGIQNIFGEKK